MEIPKIIPTSWSVTHTTAISAIPALNILSRVLVTPHAPAKDKAHRVTKIPKK